jgi:predicted enzyme related to lactoylglutathione lyase
MGSLRVELFVDDLERSATFYERVLGFAKETDSPDYVALRRSSAVLGIGLMANLPDSHPARTREGERPGLGVEIVIELDDVDAAYAKAQASGYELSSPLRDRPWGLRDFRIVDPDSYYVRVTSKS